MKTMQVGVNELGESLAELRLRTGLSEMAGSLRRHGQLTAVLCWQQAGRLEVADGFKRVAAARTLGWEHLRVQVSEAQGAGAKLLVWHSNRGTGLSDVEEAWVIRSLYRTEGLKQAQIASLVGHDKSWVCRRLMLAEGLSSEVEAWLRLGLLSTSAVREILRLPRGNQAEAAQTVIKRGLTSRQAARLVDELTGASDAEERSRVLAATTQRRRAGRPVSPGELLVADVTRIRHLGARLSARLMERSVRSLGEPAATLARSSLGELSRQLEVLVRMIGEVVGEQVHAE
jgi:ParB-like chromosome segregation protein Spo0J